MENDSPLVNLTSLRSLLGDSNESIIEILNMFLTHIPPSMVEIKGLLEKQDWDALRKKVHSIKSYYGYVGNDQLNEKLSRWESDLQGNTPGIDHQAIMSELETKTTATLARIQQVLRDDFGK